MSEYISREAVINATKKMLRESDMPFDWQNGVVDCLRILELSPAADVREVVLCKDCKFYTTFNNGCNGSCEKRIDSFVTFYPNDFCSYGERKEQT